MAQTYYLWEGDAGTTYVDLWLHEEYGNSDGLFESLVAVIQTRDLADAVALSDSLLVALPAVLYSFDLADFVLLADSAESGAVRHVALEDALLLTDDTKIWSVRQRDLLDETLISDLGIRDILRQLDILDGAVLVSDQLIRQLLSQREVVDGVQTLDSLESSGGLVYLMNSVADIYRPRLLVTMTVGAQTKQYSSEDLEA